jgi:hypothetical protein
MAGITKLNEQGRPVQQEGMKHKFTAIWALPCVWALGKTECPTLKVITTFGLLLIK